MSVIKKILEQRAVENLVELDEAAETALAKKAKESGISLSTLKTVYRRGVAAWNSGHRPGTTPQQWGMARVNSYITKGKTYHTADKDLREDVEDIDEAESWEAGYKRRVVKTTDPEHKEKGYNWRIKGKERPEISIKLYKEKPSQQEFNKQMRRVAGHEFGEEVEMMEDSRLDNKAYHKGVSDSTAKARVAHWKKMDKLSDRDPRAYEPAPGDATAKTKESKYTKKYRELYGEGMSPQEKLARAQERLRKQLNHPHPDYYKDLRSAYDIKDDRERIEKIADIKKKYQVKEAFYIEDLDEQIKMLDEMPGANMDTRAVHQHLKKAGWSLTRSSGGHDIYTHPEAKHNIPVPRHRQLKAPLVLGILKSSKLRKEEKEVDELGTSDYKIDKAGRKYKAHKIVFNKGEEDMKEELKGKQHKLDVDKDGKIEGEDLAKLRKMKKEETELDEASVKYFMGRYEVHHKGERVATYPEKFVAQDHANHLNDRAKIEAQKRKKLKQELDERELSDAEMKERERIVKGMKKSYKDFKSQYGSRAKDVMYATATKLAKEEFSEDILEELEQIDEISKSTLASYVKKASANALYSGVSAGGTMASGDYKKGGQRLDKGFKRTAGISKAVDRLAKEEVELSEEIKPYVSGDHAEGWSVLDHKGKEVKKFHWKDYMDHPVKDKRKEAYNDAVSYLKKNFNKLRKPTNECVEEHLLDLCEAMIERDEFDDRVAAYKKAGHRVLDAKHSEMKAHISFVDPEGIHRTVKYTPTGKTMQNHGPYGGGEKDESGEKVNKSEVKTIKRGRGRPRKDKFAESVDILLSLTEEEFDEIMEGSSLDEIVESLCNLSEEELKELKGE